LGVGVTVGVVNVGNGAGHSAEVARAQGMVAAQVDCTEDDALALMNARARVSHLSLEHVAAAVLDPLIRFDE
jgi:AmiR/NasT family two-component response regulator